MADYPVFPRFPFQFDTETTEKMWYLVRSWGNNLKDSLDIQNAVFLSNKLGTDKNGSISVVGRAKIGDVAATVSATAGDMRYNSSTSKFQGFDGTSWNDFH